MTTMESNAEGQLLKTDALGRVRTPASRREQLLDEFEKSGASGPQFAQLAGLKYQTFATWVQQRRRRRGAQAQTPSAPSRAPTARWLEAVVEQSLHSAPVDALALQVHLPGGARLEIRNAGQAALAATLLRTWEKPGAC